MYGAGVHAYYAGDYSRAHELLTSAIGPAATTRDPRMYYFRGLCYLRLGRDEEAKQDFEQEPEAGNVEHRRDLQHQ